MQPEDWKKYIENEKEKYKKLGSINCPAFYGGEEIYFNRHGYKHIISKGGKLRPKEEVIKRFQLLQYAKNSIANAKSISSEYKSEDKNSTAYFWEIKSSIGNLKIRIVLRRLNDNQTHFYSIMQE